MRTIFTLKCVEFEGEKMEYPNRNVHQEAVFFGDRSVMFDFISTYQEILFAVI